MSYNGTTTKYQEPALARAPNNARHNRWRWWYAAISDLMIARPDWSLQQIAVHLNKHPNTVSMIVNTDMFKEYFQQRREAYRVDHDHALRARMTEVATEGLDIVLEQLRTKRSQVPLQAALKVVESSLDRLGYAPTSGPQVVVNNAPDNRQQTIVAVTPTDLEAARSAMRLAERSKVGTSLAPPPPPNIGLDAPGACEVGQDVGPDVEVLDAEASHDSAT